MMQKDERTKWSILLGILFLMVIIELDVSEESKHLLPHTHIFHLANCAVIYHGYRYNFSGKQFMHCQDIIVAYSREHITMLFASLISCGSSVFDRLKG